MKSIHRYTPVDYGQYGSLEPLVSGRSQINDSLLCKCAIITGNSVNVSPHSSHWQVAVGPFKADPSSSRLKLCSAFGAVIWAASLSDESESGDKMGLDNGETVPPLDCVIR